MRWFAFTARKWPVDRLLALALAGVHRRLRSAAAEAVAREAVWTARVPVLREQAGSKHGEVRVQGLTGLARLGRDAEVLPFLDDRDALVRAVAGAAAQRAGCRGRASLFHRKSLFDPRHTSVYSRMRRCTRLEGRCRLPNTSTSS